MKTNLCPRCEKELKDDVLYKCYRCFTVYCKDCEDTNDGKVCPKCKMTLRLVISPEQNTIGEASK